MSNDHRFQNAPDAGQEFSQATNEQQKGQRDHEERVDWDRLEHDPPEMTFDPDFDMEPTPSGTINHGIVHELSKEEQKAIEDAQQREHEVEDSFRNLRNEKDTDDFRERMIDRFNHAREKSQEIDHD